jgi:hypothetical protein
MAQRAVSRNQGYQVGAASPISWSGLLNGDDGAPIEVSNLKDKCVHVFGTFGVGGSVTLYGSNDPADLAKVPASGTDNWVALTDPQGNAITKTAKSIEQILENPLYMACKVTAGDGTTSLTVAICGRA